MTRTCVYVDGYNLYYSRLKGTSFKWLDLAALFADQIIPEQDPNTSIVAIKYFTAPIKASYARHGQESEHAQTQYHRALLVKHPSLIQIINGFHLLQQTHLPAVANNMPPSKDNVLKVWMIEEKQTDVNIALHAYRDASSGYCDQVVFCSNDSDLEPALQMILEDVPSAIIGLVLPLREDADAFGKFANKRLTRRAHWVRSHIKDAELTSAQLPRIVPTKKKPATKPVHW